MWKVGLFADDGDKLHGILGDVPSVDDLRLGLPNIVGGKGLGKRKEAWAAGLPVSQSN